MQRTRQVLSIQSAVAYGHVGNNAAVFPLQRLGVEVWPVNTVEFSNHTGYGAWRGPVLSADGVAEVLAGVADRGVFARLDAVLSGYLGASDIGRVVVDAVAEVRAANPHVLYCADPVMGDRWCGFFVASGIPELVRDTVVPAADITTPNHFELEYLAGRPASTTDQLLEAVDAVRSLGPRVVLVTSVELPDLPQKQVSMVAVDDDGAWLVSTPKLALSSVSGSGDTTAALFLGHLLLSGSVPTALRKVASTIFAILDLTATSGATEMELVAAQQHIAEPLEEFELVRLR